MAKLGNGLIAALLLCASGVFSADATLAYAATGTTPTVLPFQEVSGMGQGDVHRLYIDGFPSIPSPIYNTAGLALARQRTFLLSAAAGDPFALPNPSSDFLLVPTAFDDGVNFHTLRSLSQFMVVELLAAGAPSGSRIYVGIDRNADKTPQRDELLCEAQLDASGAAHCAIATPLDPNLQLPADGVGGYYWILIQAPPGSPDQRYSLTVNHAELGTDTRQILATGPGHIEAGAAQPIRLAQLTPFTLPAFDGQRYYGLVDIQSAERQTQALLPFALINRSSSNDIVVPIQVPLRGYDASHCCIGSDNLIGASTSDLLVRPGESLQHLFFDIPPIIDPRIPLTSRYNPITLFFSGRAAGPTQSEDKVTLYLARTDFPEPSTSATIAPAPSGANETVKLDLKPQAGAFGGHIEIDDLRSGRWYVVATNNTGAQVSFAVQMFDGPASQLSAPVNTWPSSPPNLGASGNPTISPGFYYNPLRSGHGISLSRASGQQVVFWYTYLEDGTPQWYQAQATAPDSSSSWWHAPLYRVAWDGGKARLSQVGDITLTPIATNHFLFTWRLEGQSGSERFVQLARTGACPDFNGEATNFTGAWYAPTLSGYGMDVLSLPEQQFDVFYFYDAFGLARWGVGSSLPFSANSTLAFTQNTGFCPSCAYTPVTKQPLGTVNADYTSAASGNLSTNLVLQPPLSGSWITNKPMVRLTGSATCVQ